MGRSTAQRQVDRSFLALKGAGVYLTRGEARTNNKDAKAAKNTSINANLAANVNLILA